MPIDLIKALVSIKVACADSNHYFRKLDSSKTNAIIKSGMEILKGKYLDQFPLKI
jgi:fumarate hydratase class II